MLTSFAVLFVLSISSIIGLSYAGDGKFCVDIDECLVSNGGCSLATASCTNTYGSRQCKCHAGYTGTVDDPTTVIMAVIIAVVVSGTLIFMIIRFHA
eukprot:gene17041-18756_t